MRSHRTTIVQLSSRRLAWLLSLLLVVVIVAVYWPVLGHDFVAWDDDLHITANPRFQPVTWTQVLTFWQAPYEHLYIPLTYTVWAVMVWLTQMLWPGPVTTATLFHLFNLLCHLGNTLVVYRLGLLILGHSSGAPEGRQALAAAAGACLFGVHPLQVEAVAWVSGLKDLLCGCWALIAVWQYITYIQRPAGCGRVMTYWVATTAFLLALLAKPAAVIVPLLAGCVAMLGCQQTWRGTWRTLGVWLGLAVLWGIGTKGQQLDAQLTFVPPVWSRPVIMVDTLFFYLGKLVWPFHLGPDYGRTPQLVLEQGRGVLLGLPLLFIGIGLWRQGDRWHTLWLAGSVFIAGILPVLGGVSFLFQAYSTVADRYVYLALLGPALGVSRLVQRVRWPGVMWCFGVLALGFFAWRTTEQVMVWRHTVSLFTHALRVNPQSALAYNNLGWALARQGQLDQAIVYYTQALQLKPQMLEAHYNLGDALGAQGKFDEAIEHYTRVLAVKPTWAEVHNNLANVLLQQGQLDQAAAHYTQALQSKPDWPLPYSNLGSVLDKQGKPDEAIKWLRRAMQLTPLLPEAPYNLGGILWKQGQYAEAIAAYREALRRRPHWPQAATHLSWLLVTQEAPRTQDIAEARALAEAACQASAFRHPLPLRALAAAYYAAGQPAAALLTARQALTIAQKAREPGLVAEITAQVQQYESITAPLIPGP
jgi:tetratricopeptide (TPR) repeat protein